MNENQLTSFLSAMATELEPFDVEPTSQSAGEILSDSHICESSGIRCICGVDMHLEDEELIKCNKCQCYLHRGCLDLNDNYYLSHVYICPICQFKTDGSDPLKYLSQFTDAFNSSIADLLKMMKRGDELAEEIPDKIRKLDGPYGSNYCEECFTSLISSIDGLKQIYQQRLQKLNDLKISYPK
ncbi:PHD-finger family protein [Tritrichomonas foetus]|uniref:PHD-finger family protein n=1 Tax=Tritrichomonas foetus TaxID=1144522 RepID=A0A1J4K0E1_9EUKA|nr:PHD-finger family protein [Tritrichomonas foetus]|eukprot:OHT04200.1 PHD-finger family protein [Tritrichomonas foetus]